jgi:hypothetical protein
MWSSIRFVAFAIAVLTASACYGYYAPLNPDLTGRRIQLTLTDSGSVVLSPRVGFDIDAVEGELLTDSAGKYLMSVLTTRRRDGLENGWKGEAVAIPHTLVATLTERRFSRARTTMFVGATTFAMVAIKRIFGGAGGANFPGGTPGGPAPQ